MKVQSTLFFLCMCIQVFGQNSGVLRQSLMNFSDFEQWASYSSQSDLIVLDSLECFSITYLSDSTEVEGFIVQPKSQNDLPIVLFNRGGNRDFSKITERTIIEWLVPIARHGFSVFATQYRSDEEFGGKDLQDVLTLMAIAKTFPKVDSNKIGMVGWSRGGLMTYLALAATSEIDCAVIGGAPSDMRKLVQERPQIDLLLKVLIPEYDTQRDVELAKRSPVLWLENLHKTDLFLIHGEIDKRVSQLQTVAISNKLDSMNYIHKLWIVPNEGHILKYSKQDKDLLIAEWLKKSLQNR